MGCAAPPHNGQRIDLAAPLIMAPASESADLSSQVHEVEPPTPALRRQKTISPGEAVVHLMKGNLGPGVLALPLQFVRVGAPLGLAVLAVVGVQGVYCMWLIVVTQHAVHRQSCPTELPNGQGNSGSPLSFEDLGQLAFGQPGRRLVQWSVLCLQLGICCVFLSLVGENFVRALDVARWEVCCVTCREDKPSHMHCLPKSRCVPERRGRATIPCRLVDTARRLFI
eukprot:scaffold101874_cov35-Tisochrysis_lutea.AAC.1